ncbi:hypothetical protein ACFH04_09520 [Streptomyces noboritoensis]|uniref:Uncharacterized protein n=1 Tax=Streptomyces noboritoensis TaxID=67337 RepID=A0ABV6TFM3_9ACTN
MAILPMVACAVGPGNAGELHVLVGEGAGAAAADDDECGGFAALSE